MTLTRPDARQIIDRDTLDRITGTSNSLLDLVLRALNVEVTPPFAMNQSTSPNLVLNIGNITKTNPSTSINRTVPPINNLLPAFTSGTVTMGATGAGNATPSVGAALSLGMSANQFLKIGINITSTGSITLTKGTPSGTLAGATVPLTVDNTFAVGFVVVRTNGSNNVQNVLNSDVYQYIGGGSGSSTSGYAKIFINT